MTPEIEISQAALDSLPNCLLVDMRDAESVAYGVIPGAVPLPPEMHTAMRSPGLTRS